MYPQAELRVLAARKAALRHLIQVRRIECAAAVATLSRPLEWIDRALAQWRKLSPVLKLAAVPLALLLKRKVAPRTRILGTLLRWGPLAYGAFRGLTAAQKPSHRT
ncbi:MAG TPA: hypothetical protein VII43_09285 [Opitutaceae bacterium]